MIITARNVGPISSASVELAGYGVTCLEAPNGSGKSVLLSAVARKVHILTAEASRDAGLEAGIVRTPLITVAS